MIIDRYKDRTADELKADEKALASALKEAGAEIKGRTVKCSFCDDNHPSGSIYSTDGSWRYKCHKCGFNGSVLDVIAKIDGLEITEVFRHLKSDSRARQSKTQAQPAKVFESIETLRQAMPGVIEAQYNYTNPETGKTEMIVFRCQVEGGKKTFRQCRPAGSGFVMEAPAKPWPLYNRSRIITADTIIIVEGEKVVHALHNYGFTATTSPAGAGKAHLADWTPLAGKNAVLWPDFDEPGESHMQQIEKILQTLTPACRIAVIEPAGLDLKIKEDAADYIAQFETAGADKSDIQTALQEAVNKAKPRGVSCGVGDMIEQTIAGKRVAVKWPWACMGGLTKALLPGTVTIICGNPGASKSFLLLEAAVYWHENGYKTAIFELEESQDFHLSRCLAQKSKTSMMTDPDWIQDNPDTAREVFSQYEAFLDGFGGNVYASPDSQPTFKQLAKWTEDRAKAACRVIAIDPITAAAHSRRDSWEEDSSFLHDIKRTAVDYECSIVLVTHPIKGMSNPEMTQLAGGAGYSRFSQTILWLESHNEKTSKIKTTCGTTELEHNRVLHILKARNGKGQNVKLACNFESESLTLKELGIIIKKDK